MLIARKNDRAVLDLPMWAESIVKREDFGSRRALGTCLGRAVPMFRGKQEARSTP